MDLRINETLQTGAGENRTYQVRGKSVYLFLEFTINNKLIAPRLILGSCNAQRFNTWLDEELSPHLDVNSVVIMDNAPIHKTDQTQAVIQAWGASVLYLPPYSPDYNPVEHQFANIKRRRSYNPDKPIDQIINMYR